MTDEIEQPTPGSGEDANDAKDGEDEVSREAAGAAPLSVRRGALGEVTASTVDVRVGAIGRVAADEIDVRLGAVGFARADEVEVEWGSVGAALAGELEVERGFAGNVIARQATFEGALVRTLVAQNVTVNRPTGVLVLLAQNVSGDVRPVVGWRGALAGGLAFGVVWAVARAVRD